VLGWDRAARCAVIPFSPRSTSDPALSDHAQRPVVVENTSDGLGVSLFIALLLDPEKGPTRTGASPVLPRGRPPAKSSLC